MRYFKSILVGIIAAVVASVIGVFAVFVAPIALAFLVSRFASNGSAGIGAVSIGSGSILVVAVLGFLLGFFWTFRRAARIRHVSR